MKQEEMDIETIIKQTLDTIEKDKFQTQIGTVVSTGSGIAKVIGLLEVTMEEVVDFEYGEKGLVMSCDQYFVTVLILGNQRNIKSGNRVTRTNEKLKTKICFPKSIIDGLGQIISGEYTEEERLVWSEPPLLHETKTLNTQLVTGIKIIDWLVPIAWGQRQLIIGNKFTGKTTIAIDTMINLKNRPKTICVYVSVGKRMDNIIRVLNKLEKSGVENYILVCAKSSDTVAMKYLAPLVAMAQCEYWQSQGYDVVIFIDDLTQHAEACKEIALLMRKSPGRDSLPGDIFYIHASLLERAFKSSKNDAAITAIPILTIAEDDISGYLSTNIISITDGQFFLTSHLFLSDIKPAIDIGKSVTRVGIQHPMIKKYVSGMKLTLSQWSDIKEMAQFSSEIDEETAILLKNGQDMANLLLQKEQEPLSLEKQILILFCIFELKISLNDEILNYISNTNYTSIDHEILNHFKNTVKLLTV